MAATVNKKNRARTVRTRSCLGLLTPSQPHAEATDQNQEGSKEATADWGSGASQDLTLTTRCRCAADSSGPTRAASLACCRDAAGGGAGRGAGASGVDSPGRAGGIAGRGPGAVVVDSAGRAGRVAGRGAGA